MEAHLQREGELEREGHAEESTDVTTDTHHALAVFVPGRLCLFGEHSDWVRASRASLCLCGPPIMPLGASIGPRPLGLG
jgi:hypothetical protein